MKPTFRLSAGALAIATALAVGASADAPNVYAIKGAKIVTVSGAPIASGTVVIRKGLIEAVGASIEAPADARIIEGNGLTVYPGLIDMGNSAGLDLQVAEVGSSPLRFDMRFELAESRAAAHAQHLAALDADGGGLFRREVDVPQGDDDAFLDLHLAGGADQRRARRAFNVAGLADGRFDPQGVSIGHG